MKQMVIHLLRFVVLLLLANAVAAGPCKLQDRATVCSRPNTVYDPTKADTMCDGLQCATKCCAGKCQLPVGSTSTVPTCNNGNTGCILATLNAGTTSCAAGYTAGTFTSATCALEGGTFGGIVACTVMPTCETPVAFTCADGKIANTVNAASTTVNEETCCITKQIVFFLNGVSTLTDYKEREVNEEMGWDYDALKYAKWFASELSISIWNLGLVINSQLDTFDVTVYGLEFENEQIIDFMRNNEGLNVAFSDEYDELTASNVAGKIGLPWIPFRRHDYFKKTTHADQQSGTINLVNFGPLAHVVHELTPPDGFSEHGFLEVRIAKSFQFVMPYVENCLGGSIGFFKGVEEDGADNIDYLFNLCGSIAITVDFFDSLKNDFTYFDIIRLKDQHATIVAHNHAKGRSSDPDYGAIIEYSFIEPSVSFGDFTDKLQSFMTVPESEPLEIELKDVLTNSLLENPNLVYAGDSFLDETEIKVTFPSGFTDTGYQYDEYWNGVSIWYTADEAGNADITIEATVPGGSTDSIIIQVEVLEDMCEGAHDDTSTITCVDEACTVTFKIGGEPCYEEYLYYLPSVDVCSGQPGTVSVAGGIKEYVSTFDFTWAKPELGGAEIVELYNEDVVARVARNTPAKDKDENTISALKFDSTSVLECDESVEVGEQVACSFAVSESSSNTFVLPADISAVSDGGETIDVAVDAYEGVCVNSESECGNLCTVSTGSNAFELTFTASSASGQRTLTIQDAAQTPTCKSKNNLPADIANCNAVSALDDATACEDVELANDPKCVWLLNKCTGETGCGVETDKAGCEAVQRDVKGKACDYDGGDVTTGNVMILGEVDIDASVLECDSSFYLGSTFSCTVTTNNEANVNVFYTNAFVMEEFSVCNGDACTAYTCAQDEDGEWDCWQDQADGAMSYFLFAVADTAEAVEGEYDEDYGKTIQYDKKFKIIVTPEAAEDFTAKYGSNEVQIEAATVSEVGMFCSESYMYGTGHGSITCTITAEASVDDPDILMLTKHFNETLFFWDEMQDYYSSTSSVLSHTWLTGCKEKAINSVDADKAACEAETTESGCVAVKKSVGASNPACTWNSDLSFELTQTAGASGIVHIFLRKTLDEEEDEDYEYMNTITAMQVTTLDDSVQATLTCPVYILDSDPNVTCTISDVSMGDDSGILSPITTLSNLFELEVSFDYTIIPYDDFDDVSGTTFPMTFFFHEFDNEYNSFADVGDSLTFKARWRKNTNLPPLDVAKTMIISSETTLQTEVNCPETVMSNTKSRCIIRAFSMAGNEEGETEKIYKNILSSDYSATENGMPMTILPTAGTALYFEFTAPDSLTLTPKVIVTHGDVEIKKQYSIDPPNKLLPAQGSNDGCWYTDSSGAVKTAQPANDQPEEAAFRELGPRLHMSCACAVLGMNGDYTANLCMGVFGFGDVYVWGNEAIVAAIVGDDGDTYNKQPRFLASHVKYRVSQVAVSLVDADQYLNPADRITIMLSPAWNKIQAKLLVDVLILSEDGVVHQMSTTVDKQTTTVDPIILRKVIEDCISPSKLSSRSDFRLMAACHDQVYYNTPVPTKMKGTVVFNRFVNEDNYFPVLYVYEDYEDCTNMGLTLLFSGVYKQQELGVVVNNCMLYTWGIGFSKSVLPSNPIAKGSSPTVYTMNERVIASAALNDKLVVSTTGAAVLKVMILETTQATAGFKDIAASQFTTSVTDLWFNTVKLSNHYLTIGTEYNQNFQCDLSTLYTESEAVVSAPLTKLTSGRRQLKDRKQQLQGQLQGVTQDLKAEATHAAKNPAGNVKELVFEELLPSAFGAPDGLILDTIILDDTLYSATFRAPTILIDYTTCSTAPNNENDEEDKCEISVEDGVDLQCPSLAVASSKYNAQGTTFLLKDDGSDGAEHCIQEPVVFSRISASEPAKLFIRGNGKATQVTCVKGCFELNEDVELLMSNVAFKANHTQADKALILSADEVQLPEASAITANEESSLVITDAVISGFLSENGGGLTATDALIQLKNVNFTNNDASNGASIKVVDCEVTIVECEFSSNTAQEDGGALFIVTSTVDVVNSTFVRNKASNGGAIAQQFSTFTIKNSEFSLNEADMYGGGLFCLGDFAPSIFTDTNFRNNIADMGGGALALVRTAALITRGVCTGNHAQNGGCVDIGLKSELRMTNVTISENTAEMNGAGMVTADQSFVELKSVDFRDNKAERCGGCLASLLAPALFFEDVTMSDNTALCGGGIHWDYELVNISNIIMSGNKAEHGNDISSDAKSLGWFNNLTEFRGRSGFACLASSTTEEGAEGVVAKTETQPSATTDTAATSASNNTVNTTTTTTTTTNTTTTTTTTTMTTTTNATANGTSVASAGDDTDTTTIDVIIENCTQKLEVALLDYYGEVVVENTDQSIRLTSVGNSTVSGSIVEKTTRGGVAEFQGLIITQTPNSKVVLRAISSLGADLDNPNLESNTPNAKMKLRDCQAGEEFTSVGEDRSTCNVCERGFYSTESTKVAGVWTCVACWAGSMQDQVGQTTCRPCPKGTSSEKAAEFCFDCEGDTYTPRTNMSQCLPCPPNSISVNQTSCTCERNFYGVFDGDTMSCVNCPDGANCEEKGTLKETVKAMPQYYPAVDGSNEFFALCPIPENCQGGAEPCKEGYEGHACAKCAAGSQKDIVGGCEPCGNPETYTFRMIGILLLAILLAAAMVFNNFKSALKDSNTAGTVTKIMLSAIQLNSSSGGRGSGFDFNWPSIMMSYLKYTNMLSSIGANIFAVDCFLKDKSKQSPFYIKVILMAALPPMVFAFTPFFLLPMYLWQKYKKKRADVNHYMGFIYITSVVVVLFLVQPSITEVTFQLFSCRHLALEDKDLRYLIADLDVRCDTPGHTAMKFGLGVPMMILYVIGIPSALVYLSWRNRKALRTANVLKKYGFIYKSYTNDRFYWEAFVFWRKIMLLIIAVFVPTKQVAISLVLFMLMICLCLQVFFLPFNSQSENALEFASLIVSYATYFMGQFMLSTTGNDGESTIPDADREVLGYLLLIINIGFLLCGFTIILADVAHKKPKVMAKLNKCTRGKAEIFIDFLVVPKNAIPEHLREDDKNKEVEEGMPEEGEDNDKDKDNYNSTGLDSPAEEIQLMSISKKDEEPDKPKPTPNVRRAATGKQTAKVTPLSPSEDSPV